jgi:hypothetical protein
MTCEVAPPLSRDRDAHPVSPALSSSHGSLSDHAPMSSQDCAPLQNRKAPSRLRLASTGPIPASINRERLRHPAIFDQLVELCRRHTDVLRRLDARKALRRARQWQCAVLGPSPLAVWSEGLRLILTEALDRRLASIDYRPAELAKMGGHGLPLARSAPCAHPHRQWTRTPLR